MPPLQGPRAPLCWMRYPVNTSIRPSSMRTGTSTCTSRNGLIRMRRMYASRLMRSAARSNWLWTMALPDIGERAEGPVDVTAGEVGGSSGAHAAARQAGARVLRFRQGVRWVGRSGAPLARVRQDADHVGGGGADRLGRVLHYQHEA